MKKIILFVITLCIPLGVFALSDSALDSRAKTLPSDYSTTKEQLVEALTRGLTTPADKARVIAGWIAYQVDRNGYEYDQRIRASNDNDLADNPIPNDVFKTRIGTPAEFAQLYAELATLAGLEVAVIEGYAGHNVPSRRYSGKLMKALEPNINKLRGGTYHLQRYRAAWNAVKINGKWNLLDTYWMVKGEKMLGRGWSERDFIREMKKRIRRVPSASQLSAGKTIDNDYFFAKPRDFIDTHFPDETKWQLLAVPKTWSSFTN